MISTYNRSKLIRAALFLLVSLTSFTLAFFFFRFGAALTLKLAGWSTSWSYWIALAALAGVLWSGLHTWRSKQGFQVYSESSFYHDIGGASGTTGGHAVDYMAREYTGTAYVLSQIILSGPLFLMRGLQELRMRLPQEAGLELKLNETLNALRQANKWQGMGDHPGREKEILLLARMKQIDFSVHSGQPRFKAQQPSS